MTTGCRVRGCRFPASHVTCSHKCGTCGTYGHGQQECGKMDLIHQLIVHPSYRARLSQNMRCTVDGCVQAWSHTTTAHNCSICNARGGAHANSCTANAIVTRTCPMCKSIGPVDLHRKLYTGAECSICMEAGPVIVFEHCSHACVCSDCARRL